MIFFTKKDYSHTKVCENQQQGYNQKSINKKTMKIRANFALKE